MLETLGISQSCWKKTASARRFTKRSSRIVSHILLVVGRMDETQKGEDGEEETIEKLKAVSGVKCYL